MGIGGKKEASNGLYCVPEAPRTGQILTSTSELSLPNNIISRSRAFSCLLTIDPHFWAIYTPVIATSENLLPPVAEQSPMASFV